MILLAGEPATAVLLILMVIGLVILITGYFMESKTSLAGWFLTIGLSIMLLSLAILVAYRMMLAVNSMGQ